MSTKNCKRCGKTVYSIEGLQAGEDFYHKLCFKCSTDGCRVKLNLKSYKKDPKTGSIFCDKHLPKDKPTQVADSVLTKHAMSAPKKETQSGVHKADPKVAPKISGDYSNDRKTETGEFEGNPEASSADTGHSWGTAKVESGEFEGHAEASTADTGHSWGTQDVQAGEFENTPEPSQAHSGGSWGASNPDVRGDD